MSAVAWDRPRPPDDPSPASVARLGAALVGALAANTTLRARHPTAPALFLRSELALFDAVRALSPLAVHPTLYPSLPDSALTALAALLAHPNDDLLHPVVALLRDLALLDPSDPTTHALHTALHARLLSTGILSALTDALHARLLPPPSATAEDEAPFAESAAAAWAVFEHALDASPHLARPLADRTRLILVCVARLRSRPPDPAAVELLAVLLQEAVACKDAFVAAGGVDALLHALAPYRSRGREMDTASESRAERAELVENLFALMCSVLLAGEGAKKAFVKLEGVQLMLSFMKISSEYRRPATKVLDFACTWYAPAVQVLMACGGLGVVFAVLQVIGDVGKGKGPRKRKRALSPEHVKTLTEHVFGVLFSAFRYANKEQTDRLVYKFWESDGEKTIKVLLLYRHFAQEVEDATGENGRYLQPQIAPAETPAFERPQGGSERLLERLDAGLFILQMGAAIVAQVITSSHGDLKAAVLRYLPQVDLNVILLERALKEYADSIETGDDDDEGKAEREKERQRILALAGGMHNFATKP